MAYTALMTPGRLIVIDGSDGSGKSTQTQLLVEKLRATNTPIETLKFVQYKENLVGKLIGECIAGEHGDFVHSDPYITSILYAADRFESREKMRAWLAEGKVVILDRYTSANQIHQGGKIADENKRAAFLDWLDRLEYGVFGLPRADLTLYLHLQTELSVALIQEREKKDKRTEYLKEGQRDTLEMDISYLEHAQMSAEWLMRHQKGWAKIECAPEGTIRTREDIAEEVYAAVTQQLV